MSESCCTWLAENTGRKKLPSGHHRLYHSKSNPLWKTGVDQVTNQQYLEQHIPLWEEAIIYDTVLRLGLIGRTQTSLQSYYDVPDSSQTSCNTTSAEHTVEYSCHSTKFLVPPVRVDAYRAGWYSLVRLCALSEERERTEACIGNRKKTC